MNETLYNGWCKHGIPMNGTCSMCNTNRDKQKSQPQKNTESLEQWIENNNAKELYEDIKTRLRETWNCPDSDDITLIMIAIRQWFNQQVERNTVSTQDRIKNIESIVKHGIDIIGDEDNELSKFYHKLSKLLENSVSNSNSCLEGSTIGDGEGCCKGGDKNRKHENTFPNTVTQVFKPAAFVEESLEVYEITKEDYINEQSILQETHCINQIGSYLIKIRKR